MSAWFKVTAASWALADLIAIITGGTLGACKPKTCGKVELAVEADSGWASELISVVVELVASSARAWREAVIPKAKIQNNSAITFVLDM